MTRYAMVADLERCVGCQTCTAACRHANATSPAVQWRKVLDIETGAYPNVNRIFVPVGCQHCEDPPCMHVCPTTATRQRADGIVTVDYDLCIGCTYCEMACPYQARFKVSSPGFAFGKGAMQDELARHEPQRIGVSQKCTFCADRIDFGVANGLVPGVDMEATPACVNSCMSDALQFGDLHDPASTVSRLLGEQSHFRMHEALGTGPGFYYLHDKRHAGAGVAEHRASDAPLDGEVERSQGKGGEPRCQQHWDWKAACNFLCGGAGSGLFAVVVLSGVTGTYFAALGLASLGMIALGLSILMFKIGRPLRFLNVLRHPQRSWMSREAWIAAALFPLALISLEAGSRQFGYVAALLGILFLYAQARILKESKGIPAWRSRHIVPLVVATGLAEGMGLFAAATAFRPIAVSLTGAALVGLALLRHLAWRAYVDGMQAEGAPTRSLEVLEGYRARFFTLGLALPIALVALGALLHEEAGPLFAVAGLSLFATGWALKFIIVTRAAYGQGVMLERVRATRSGVARTAVTPGWTFPEARSTAPRDRTAAPVR